MRSSLPHGNKAYPPAFFRKRMIKLGLAARRACSRHAEIPEKPIYIERREAVIDFPEFSRQQIQVCFDVFSMLVRAKMLPLRLPFLSTERLPRGYSLLTRWMIGPARSLCDSVGILRRLVIYRPRPS